MYPFQNLAFCYSNLNKEQLNFGDDRLKYKDLKSDQILHHQNKKNSKTSAQLDQIFSLMNTPVNSLKIMY